MAISKSVAEAQNIGLKKTICGYGSIISRGEIAIGIIVLVAWITFFLLGLFTPTIEMRQAIMFGIKDDPKTDNVNEERDLYREEKIGYFISIASSYTLTNIFFLTCFASILGCMAQRWQVSDEAVRVPSNSNGVTCGRVYLSAVLRSFLLYLAVVSGFLIVSNAENIIHTEFDQYVRTAGMISTLGFVTGYDPNLITGLINKVLNLTNFTNEEEELESQNNTD